jgi:hypothetical protein
LARTEFVDAKIWRWSGRAPRIWRVTSRRSRFGNGKNRSQGIIALPAAAAPGVAATATYGVALIERGFEVLESAVGEVGRVLTTASHFARSARDPRSLAS